MSTISFELAFSIGSKIIDQYHIRLSPYTIEAVFCMQDWLWYEYYIGKYLLYIVISYIMLCVSVNICMNAKSLTLVLCRWKWSFFIVQFLHFEWGVGFWMLSWMKFENFENVIPNSVTLHVFLMFPLAWANLGGVLQEWDILTESANARTFGKYNN